MINKQVYNKGKNEKYLGFYNFFKKLFFVNTKKPYYNKSNI